MGPVNEINRAESSWNTQGLYRATAVELAFVLARRQPRLAPEMEFAHGHDHGLLDGADAGLSISDACFLAQAGKPS